MVAITSLPRSPPKFSKPPSSSTKMKRNIKLLAFLAVILISFLNYFSVIQLPSTNFDTSQRTSLSDSLFSSTSEGTEIDDTDDEENDDDKSLVKKLGGIDDVLHLDRHLLNNVRATLKGAYSWLDWTAHALSKETILADNLNQFQAAPLVATVDRRLTTVNKQMNKDFNGHGTSLGCSLIGSTFLSNLEYIDVKGFEEDAVPFCDVCFEFSSREDAEAFVPGVGYEMLSELQSSTATKCFAGEASLHARFPKWQVNDERFEGFGYPWTIECMLPNGIKELTCESITRFNDDEQYADSFAKIYFQTKFNLYGYFNKSWKEFFVSTRWPWDAVKSHDDNRYRLATSLPRTWDDTSSIYVPKNPTELKLAHVEGPGFTRGDVNGTLSLQSVLIHDDSKGGIHPRLLTNLFHLLRNAPHSTHYVAVVSGQVNASYNYLKSLLLQKVEDLYPKYAKVFTHSLNSYDHYERIPIDDMVNPNVQKENIRRDLTLLELLRSRGMKIVIAPIVTPSIMFEKSVCGGQYAFTTFLAARYAADYQVMMFIDGDTAMIEQGHQTLQDIFYKRFYSKESSKCAGHRFRLIEQFVLPQDETSDRLLQCAADLALDKKKWDFINENCKLKEGHIVARTDSILAFSVHHPDTDVSLNPEGVEDCITRGNKVDTRYFFTTEEVIQVHLRDRERDPRCACFVNHE